MDKKYNVYFKIPLFQEGPEWPMLLTSSKVQPCLLKQSLKTHIKLKVLQIIY